MVRHRNVIDNFYSTNRQRSCNRFACSIRETGWWMLEGRKQTRNRKQKKSAAPRRRQKELSCITVSVVKEGKESFVAHFRGKIPRSTSGTAGHATRQPSLDTQ